MEKDSSLLTRYGPGSEVGRMKVQRQLDAAASLSAFAKFSDSTKAFELD